MHEAMLPPLQAWLSFYVIVGSSAAALTGLQFVVIVLGANLNVLSRTSLRAFGTPTIVHFCATLLLSAIVSAPWKSISGVSTTLIVFSIAGVLYIGRVLIHARRQDDYTPVIEDWLWHFLFPALAYAMLFAAALWIRWNSDGALFVIGGTALSLLSIGIHNAWDAATYIAIDRPRAP